MEYVVGVDVGGTFTDFISVAGDGSTVIVKTPSTPADPSDAVLDGLKKIASKLEFTLPKFLGKVQRICHGTTVSTNTILTWTGAKVGLLCTKGFRDTLAIRFGIREHMYDYTVPVPKSLVPRYLRVPVQERMKWNGEEVVPLNEDQVREACRYFKAHGIEAVAVCFVWSFKYPEHERRAVEICRQELPDKYIVGSHDIQPEVREYWRMSTTVLSAYVGPALSRYIRHLSRSLKEAGFAGELLITQSNAGVIPPETAVEQAVRTVLSGPACAPAAAAYLTKPMNIGNLITIDMGGTSFDVCLIKDSMPMTTLTSAVGGVYHMRLPLIDIHTIGTGGGSKAWLDAMNVLHMGPQSAGADPGPACYDKGGTEPTCTDADLLLGYLNPDYFLGGEIKLRPELARKAIKEKVADRLGLDVFEAARAMKRISDASMVDGISTVSVRRGEDPRRYMLVAAGGAGPVHAVWLARALNMKRVMVPRLSSIFCALGSIIADIRHDFVKSVTVRTKAASPDLLNTAYKDMEHEAHRYLEREGIVAQDRYFLRSIDMRYKGQYHEVEVPALEDPVTEDSLQQITEAFHQKHEALYAYRDVVDTEMINLRLAAFGKVKTPERKEQSSSGGDSSRYSKVKRDVYFEESGGFASTPIYDGDLMRAGDVVEGPAVVEQRTTTVVIPPKGRLAVTSYGDFMIELL